MVLILLVALCTAAQTSGTSGKIAKFKSPTTLGDSVITEDKEGRVGIGTSLPTSKLTVQGVIEARNGFKFPDGSQLTSGNVVKSLNSLSGDLILQPGANLTLMAAGNTLTVAAPNALSRVEHDATLTGDGTLASPLKAVSTEVALQPYTKGADCIIANSQTLAVCVITTVPVGKRWVIEYVSGNASPSVGQVLTGFSIESSGPNHYFTPHSLGSDGAFTFLSVSQTTKIYVDGGTEVSFKITRRPPLNGLLSATITVSGFLVDLP